MTRYVVPYLNLEPIHHYFTLSLFSSSSLIIITMGDSDLQAETREKVKKEAVTKIHGQPSHTAIMKLEEELNQIAVVIQTLLRGGELGHAGLIIEPSEYEKHSIGISFN